jgi:hypothetical protein
MFATVIQMSMRGYSSFERLLQISSKLWMKFI